MSGLSRRSVLAGVLAAGSSAWPPGSFAQGGAPSSRMQSWRLMTPRRTGIHDLAPAPDGGVWFTAQRSGHLGWFDPKNGQTELIALGSGSSPHGVIQGPDGAAWITDSGLGAIVRVSWPQREVRRFALAEDTPYANLNTCAFDGDGDLWFTGQSGVIGKVAVRTGTVSVRDAPGGRGPYGICSTPRGEVWWCSLAGSFIARIDRRTGDSVVVQPPTSGQGARRVWSDSAGRIWVSEWNSGQLSVHDPANGRWRAWKPSGDSPRCYAVYVDERDIVWIAEWSSNAVFSFDPAREQFDRFDFPRRGVGIRQILGRKGEVWLPESGTEHITVIRTG
ncbi:MAG TPA: lyase [Burkholderiaceae bacterium]|nr:lyase [Burkholderiaceae bacterium]